MDSVLSLELDEDEDAVQEAEGKATATKARPDLFCHLCPAGRRSFKNRTHLLSHYTYHHYKAEIQKIAGDPPNTKCPLCGRNKDCHSKLLEHIGAIHRVVENFLPEEQL